MEKLNEYKEILKNKTPEEVLIWAENNFLPERIALSSSFGAEDQVLTDIISNNTPNIRVFTLDT
jgi:phosphoadenosine phosphosulfate reductase